MAIGVAAGAAAMSARARRRIVAALRDQGAFSMARAIPIAQPRTVDRRMLQQMLREKAVVEASPGRYFLDEAALAAAEARARRNTYAVFAGAAVIVGALVIYLRFFLR